MSVVVAAHNEESVIERRIENLRALDYPADRLEIVVTSDASTDRTEELGRGGRRAGDPQSPRRQGRRAGSRGARDDLRRRRLLRRQREWTPDALRKLVRELRRPRRRATSAAARTSRPGRGRNKEGAYWRYELCAARRRVARRARSPAATARSTRSPRAPTSRSTRASATTSRFPYLMVQHGRRAVYEPDGDRGREGDADERGRVPPQGADVRALLGDRARGQDAPAAAAALPGSRSSRTDTCATRAGCSISSCSARSSRSWRGAALRGGARAPARRSLAAARARRRARRATTSSSRGPRSRRWCELPAPRRPADVGGRGGDAMNRAADVAVAGAALLVASPVLGLAALAVRLRTAGLRSTARRAWARTAPTSSC